MKKLDNGVITFKCPGCKIQHNFSDSWQFNGDFEKPTVTPSILVTGCMGADSREFRCHSFITDGYIKFLDDCSHELKGQTVLLPNGVLITKE